MISVAEFKRLDLRVAQVIDAEPIAGTDRLLRVDVDLGEERRTVVAGVARDYTPDQLVGSKVIIASNFEPRTIRGVTSQGMLLGVNCHVSQQIALLTVNRPVENGARVE